MFKALKKSMYAVSEPMRTLNRKMESIKGTTQKLQNKKIQHLESKTAYMSLTIDWKLKEK